MKTTYKEVSLFGGAANCDIPRYWVDVALIRDVPSHQEVYADVETEDSVIVEILEYEKIEDRSAGAFFFNDLARADSSVASSIDSSRSLVISSTQLLGSTASTVYVEGVQEKSKSDRSSIAKPVMVFMTVIRAVEYDSDILVTTHSLVDEFGPERARNIHSKIASSLTFTDSALFG